MNFHSFGQNKSLVELSKLSSNTSSTFIDVVPFEKLIISLVIVYGSRDVKKLDAVDVFAVPDFPTNNTS
jgi:hypothetical protein